MNKKKDLSILFIGNSHTYYNDMPLMVKRRAEEEGQSCRVTMIAHGGWYLSQHAEESDIRFNILYGKYDYVVLQEHAHPFGPEEDFLNSACALNKMIRKAGSTPIIYECWAKKDEPELQDHMNTVHRHVAEEIGALHSLHQWVKTGGPIRKAGPILKCMTRMVHMPPTQARISQPS